MPTAEPPDPIDPTEEAYERGRNAALLRILQQCARELGIKDATSELAALMEERQSAIVQLRSICGLIGDNDWPDSLHLGDILEKHLADHLDWSEYDAHR